MNASPTAALSLAAALALAACGGQPVATHSPTAAADSPLEALPTGGKPFYLDTTLSPGHSAAPTAMQDSGQPYGRGQGALLEGTPHPLAISDRSRPVAVVNGEPITWEEYERASSRPEGGETLLDLIDARLVAQEAETIGIEVSEEELERELERRRQGLPRDATEEEMLDRYGYTMEEYRDAARLRVALVKLLEPHIALTEEEIADYYERNKSAFASPLQYRLYRITVDDEADARRAADALRAGEPPEEVRRRHASEQVVGKSGDLGYLGLAELDPVLAAQVSALDEGGVAGPLADTDGGVSVLLLTDVRGGTTPPLVRVRERVREELLLERAKRLAPSYLRTLRQKARISSQLPLED
ncbi:MAG: peptidylprolyl isomerase [Chloroflexota bacterium]|nr:peptidylprolyl isomerase [Chloroflexota bacterium]